MSESITKETVARPNLILASESPRRLDLLRQIGVEPNMVKPADIDETPIKAELPRNLANRLAVKKAKAIKSLHMNDVVLAADTVVGCGRRILSKAETENEARQYLKLLSGRRHRVYGGVCVIDKEGNLKSRLVITTVSFKRLTSFELDTYLASREWQGKAGAYAIQGKAAAFVRQINGSYSNVVGLPLFETVALLNNAGISTMQV